MTKKIRKPFKPHPFNVETPVKSSLPPVEPAAPLPPDLAPPEPVPPAWPWLTVETALYALIFALALALRLAQLGAYPLSDLEAQHSLPALAFYRSDLFTAGDYSPLLVSLNALVFLLFGSSDTSARLVSLVLGLALVILPLTLRRHLGQRVCLLASALLAISPSAVYLSRTLNPEIGVATGSLMIVSGFFNWADQRQPRWLFLLAAGLALMLTSGPLAYSVIIVFGLIAWGLRSAFKAITEGRGENGEERRDTNPLPSLLSPLSSVAVFFVAAVVLLSTAGLFNLNGMGMLSSTLTDWVSRFSFDPRPDAGFNAVFLLTIYEPLLVLAGLAGLALLAARPNILTIVFGLWFGGLLLLDLVMAGRPSSSVIVLITPLAFLAASALFMLGESVTGHGSWSGEGFLFFVSLVLSVAAYIFLTAWLINLYGADTFLGQYTWALSLLALAALVVFAVFFWLMDGPPVAIRGVALAAVALALLVTINAGWRLNYGPLSRLAYQPLAGAPAAPGLEALSETLALQSAQRLGDNTIIDLALAGVNSPALRWRLRDYRQLQPTLNSNVPTTVIITSLRENLGLEQPYRGQDFALNAHWSPVGLSVKPLIKWLLYRQADDQPPGDKVILWLREESKP